MAKPVKLTAYQKGKLRPLWFIYGNDGIHHTHYNHKYIQGFLEYGEDREEDYKIFGGTQNAITDKCLAEVKAIVYANS